MEFTMGEQHEQGLALLGLACATAKFIAAELSAN